MESGNRNEENQDQLIQKSNNSIDKYFKDLKNIIYQILYVMIDNDGEENILV
jgi:hypothetical protein